MLLDGANRITALRKLNYPHVVVQVVKPDAQRVAQKGVRYYAETTYLFDE